MANSADPDQLASSDLHCMQRQGISGVSRTRVKSPFRTIFFTTGRSKPVVLVLIALLYGLEAFRYESLVHV